MVPATLVQLSRTSFINLDHNKFTFAGIGKILRAHVYDYVTYSAQANIKVHENGGILSVFAGGVLSDNTYKWHKDGKLIATITGDSTFQPTESGNYYVAVTNAVAVELKLHTDTIAYTAHLNETHLN